MSLDIAYEDGGLETSLASVTIVATGLALRWFKHLSFKVSSWSGPCPASWPRLDGGAFFLAQKKKPRTGGDGASPYICLCRGDGSGAARHRVNYPPQAELPPAPP